LRQSNSSKKIKSSSKEINKVNDHIDRGFEFILKGGKKKQNDNQLPEGDRKMSTDIVLTLFLPVSLLFFFVGTLFGWAARDYMMNYREVPRPHPEMLDINGNIIPDEVIAFRFENNYDNNDDDEEDD